MILLDTYQWIHSNISEYNRNLYFDVATDKWYLEVVDENYGDYLYYHSNECGEELGYIGYTNAEDSVDGVKGKTMKLDPSIPT